MIVNENTSIAPDEDVGVGALAPTHLIVAPEPLMFNVVGLYPVEPCVWNNVTEKTRPSVVGAFVMFIVKFALKFVLVR